ncbi:hypothetical protein LINPERPRIM_LOCUS42643 [Linum perenne]
MMLENLMEEKQLNFRQPFLSVRRPPSTPERNKSAANSSSTNYLPPLPHYKPELKSGPIRVPGTVPFVWERSPGRPKNGTTDSKVLLPATVIAPRLPPGKKMAPLMNKMNKMNTCSDAAGSEERSSSSASQSPAGSCSANVEIAEDKLREVMEEIRSSVDDDDEEEEYESFVDALDTLSRTESSLLNCSFSGISEMDGVDHTRLNRTISGDLHAREFMIGRFLPAAKAMANESPQYSSQYPTKKQPVLREQSRQIVTIKRFENDEKKPVSRGDIVPYYDECGTNTVEEEEEDDSSEPDTSTIGVCGLFPRLCLQNSLCRLNPVPGIRKQAGHGHASSVRTRRVKYDKAAEHGRRVMNEPRHSRNRAKLETIDDARTRCQTAESNAGWSHNGSSPQPGAAPKDQAFLGVPEKHKAGSIPAVKEVVSFAELLAHDDLEWEASNSATSPEEKKKIDSVEKQVVEEVVDKSASLGPCTDRRDRDLVLAHRQKPAQTQQNRTNPSQRKPCNGSNNSNKNLLPLPLPKSPSESWLKKALPTVSSRTQMSKSPLGMMHQKEAQIYSTTSDPTWETMVKTSGEKNRRFQFSEAQLTPIPEA